MDIEFIRLLDAVKLSGCAKKQISAGTYVNGYWYQIANTCVYEGLLCPRLKLPTGVGYELCEAQHAENRLAQILNDKNLKSDGVAWVYGHYYACEPCASRLKSIGVKEIRVRESS